VHTILEQKTFLTELEPDSYHLSNAATMTSNDQVSLLLPMHHLMSWEEIVMEVEEGLATAFLSSC
jgi:hypothetical protein